MPCQIQVVGARTCIMLLKKLRLGMQLCDALFYGVVVVDFEDAVAGSCAKKATARVADGDEISDHRNLLEV
ncbi:hypothetical protein BHM03_00031018 [Ensete ventricosum]|nr:hypothetical protein BHM03_00031018 [Ensete ventricosum]